MPTRKLPFLFLSLAILSLAGGSLSMPAGRQALAQTADELQGKINQRTTDIKNLEKEIAEYQKQITALGSQANTLSATIKSLELTQKKLAADISVTENKIAAKTFEIQQLSLDIQNKEETIDDDHRIVSRSLISINETSNYSLEELLIGSPSLSVAWDSVEKLSLVQKNLIERIKNLEEVKVGLEHNRDATEQAKSELIALNTQLKDQRKVVMNTTAEKNSLLKETKNNEANYNKLLKTRQQQKEAFEREVDALQNQLNITIHLSNLPHTGSGVLIWPLENIRVTQYFGNTSFSTSNPQIYKTGTHPGIDFAASIGTPVKAALTGIVTGAGDMDTAGGGRCRAYGRWVMIKHDNGLSTLYAHLSLFNVGIGQAVSTGQIIGYSGNTGAVTGPHLHFGVYATEGVRITNLVSSSYCAGVLYPLADPKALLNPLSYL